MKISVIIPVLNEEANIGKLVTAIRQQGGEQLQEVIVCDGGSMDGTVDAAIAAGARVIKAGRGRAVQMNAGAAEARAETLLFFHADVRVGFPFPQAIEVAIAQGTDLGCFRYRFDSRKKILRFNGYMTRFNGLWAGGGDQGLFIGKKLFQEIGGYRQDFRIMEDFDLVARARKAGKRFDILPQELLVSDRKYDKNSWLRVQLANAIIVIAWKLGTSQNWMVNAYKKLLRW